MKSEHTLEPRTLQFIADAVEGRLYGAGSVLASGVTLDSRKISAGDLFVAVKGERFDGHEYIDQVFASGAAAVLVESKKIAQAKIKGPAIVVNDTRTALGKLAAKYRKDFTPNIVAVAGSNGKTTTKNLLAAVLNEKFKTLASEASFNNDIGVPVTLLNLSRDHGAAVLEAGTNHPGELRPLVQMIAPNFGVLTSIGPEHLEFFKDLSGVADEESAIASELPNYGTFFVNLDSPEIDRVMARSRVRTITVGFSERAEWRISGATMSEDGMKFTVAHSDREMAGSYSTCLIGMHQVLNATLAIAVGRELGLGRAEIQRGLSQCQPAKMRLQIKQVGSIKIFDDTYNANEDSMKAALQTLAAFPQSGRRVAILGSMGELGSAAAAAHFRVGECAAQTPVGALAAVGPFADAIAEGARKAGLNAVRTFSSRDEVISDLDTLILPGDLVLVKASRSGQLERVVDALTTRFAQ